jgi:hypothetical protein
MSCLRTVEAVSASLGSGPLTNLLGTIPLLPAPLLIQKEFVVFVSHYRWAECPWSFETASSSMASAKGMCSAQCNNLLIVETHAIENVS